MTWKDATGATHQLESDFAATPSKSWLDQVWDWITSHWWLWLILALLAVALYLLNKQRERQRQMQAGAGRRARRARA